MWRDVFQAADEAGLLRKDLDLTMMRTERGQLAEHHLGVVDAPVRHGRGTGDHDAGDGALSDLTAVIRGVIQR